MASSGCFIVLSSAGIVPEQLCGLTGLTFLSLSRSTNTSLMCYPRCLLSVGSLSVTGMSKCHTLNEEVLCPILAATNIQTLRPEWMCDSEGYISIDPCNVWSGVVCEANQTSASVLNFNSFGLTGCCMMLNNPIQ